MGGGKRGRSMPWQALIPQTPHAAWQWWQSQLRGLSMFANVLISVFSPHCSWSKLFTGHVINLAVSTRLHTCKHVESGFNFRLCELLIAHWSSTGEFTLLLVAQFRISVFQSNLRSRIWPGLSPHGSKFCSQLQQILSLHPSKTSRVLTKRLRKSTF